jgi:K+/H+ antiporter YhaU regulatory subunit KhtT
MLNRETKEAETVDKIIGALVVVSRRIDEIEKSIPPQVNPK